MSEFNVEDLDAVISEAKNSLVQMLALQLKNQLKHGAELEVQLANAESKCRELAAENAGLKISESDLDLMCAEMSEDGWESVLTKTPATDAFLAEVRAQGADECVRQLVTSDDDGFSDAPNICAMVAHQLRKGAAL